MSKFFNKVTCTVKKVAANRVVRNVCVIALLVHIALLIPLTLANLFDPVYTGLLLVSVCLVLDMVPDGFVQDGDNESNKKANT